jgi:hypothetical protein
MLMRPSIRSGEPAGPCPLFKLHDGRLRSIRILSRVTVTQEFENPYQDKIEAR